MTKYIPKGFQPGNKLQTIGNRNRAGALRQIKDLLAEAVSEDDIIDMLAVQVMKAKTGNTDACRLVLSYRLGSPDQVQNYVKERPKVLNIAYVNTSPTGAPMPDDVDREEGSVEGGGGTHPAPINHPAPIPSSGGDTPDSPSQIIDAEFSESASDGTISETGGSSPQTFDSVDELIDDLDDGSVSPDDESVAQDSLRTAGEIVHEAVQDMVDAGLSPLGGVAVE
jgi:hypothetical protein